MKKSTQELLDILKNTPAFSNYAEQEEAELIEVSLSDYLNRLIQAKNQDLPSLIRKSGLTVLTVIRFLMGANVLPVTKCSPSASSFVITRPITLAG